MVEAIGAPTAQVAAVTPQTTQNNNQVAGDVNQMNNLLKNQESSSDDKAAEAKEELEKAMTKWIIDEMKKIMQKSREALKEA